MTDAIMTTPERVAYTPQEITELYGIRAKTVCEWARTGRIKSRKVGKTVCIEAEDWDQRWYRAGHGGAFFDN